VFIYIHISHNMCTTILWLMNKDIVWVFRVFDEFVLSSRQNMVNVGYSITSYTLYNMMTRNGNEWVSDYMTWHRDRLILIHTMKFEDGILPTSYKCITIPLNNLAPFFVKWIYVIIKTCISYNFVFKRLLTY